MSNITRGQLLLKIVRDIVQKQNPATCHEESSFTSNNNPDVTDIEQNCSTQISDFENYVSDDDDFVKDPSFIPESSAEDWDEYDELGETNEAEQSGATVDENQVNIVIPISSSLRKTRRKYANKNEWERNKLKKLKQSGQVYTSRVNKKVASKREVKIKNCSKCPKKCSTKFSIDILRDINEKFWSINSPERQKQYISSLIVQKQKSSVRTTAGENSRRKFSRNYFLTLNHNHAVCKGFFLSTFNISGKFVDLIVKNRDSYNMIKADQRGRHPPGNKRSLESKEYIKNHIASFPKVPSHYSRKNTNKEYLESNLSVNKMYQLYVEKCDEDGVNHEKLWLYRDIFNKEFNLSFHTPKNDLCDTCFVFENLHEDKKEEARPDFDAHIERKNSARLFKNIYKDEAANGKCLLVEFDLEAVLYTPKCNAKALFYKNKLAVYNLTVLHVEAKIAYCYMWHEGIAKRGSIEVASCLLDFLTKSASGKPIYFFSDTCGGQNRNINMATMCLYSVNKLNIPEINHLYFESGHSQMECDSVHANIEKKTKSIDIFDPTGWYTAVRMAGSSKTVYEVIEMTVANFFDFSTMQKMFLKNRTIDTKGEKVNWLKIKWLQYRKGDPQHIYFKYNQNNEDFRTIQVTRQNRYSNIEEYSLNHKYNAPVPIKSSKYRDLMHLCSNKIIKETYHDFYKLLKHEETPTDIDDDNNAE